MGGKGNWGGFLGALAPPAQDGEARLRAAGLGAAPAELGEAETVLGVRFPDELRELLREMDGVRDEPAYLLLILSVREIVSENLAMRQFDERRRLRVAVGRLLFFAADGNGDLYAFPVVDGVARGDAVLWWNHEADSVEGIAGSLRDFLRRWVATRRWT